jgi:hypothetical protein
MKNSFLKTNISLLRNVAIIICSALSSCILFSPAQHFGEVVIRALMPNILFLDGILAFGVFCGAASVGATTFLCFNAWDAILSLPEKTALAFLKRGLFYLGGIMTSAPLMMDTFTVNQSSLSLGTNLIVTILPGLFMSGVYGQAIEFIYEEFRRKNRRLKIDSQPVKVRKNMAIGIGLFLGVISAIGCYWESLNILSSVVQLSLLSYCLSILPVMCRAPLFIKGAYGVSYQLLNVIDNFKKPSVSYSMLLIFICFFSLFTIGGYSDIVYNGIRGSQLYQTSLFFQVVLSPFILSVAMLSMLLLNIDALLNVAERVKLYLNVNSSTL